MVDFTEGMEEDEKKALDEAFRSGLVARTFDEETGRIPRLREKRSNMIPIPYRGRLLELEEEEVEALFAQYGGYDRLQEHIPGWQNLVKDLFALASRKSGPVGAVWTTIGWETITSQHLDENTQAVVDWVTEGHAFLVQDEGVPLCVIIPPSREL